MTTTTTSAAASEANDPVPVTSATPPMTKTARLLAMLRSPDGTSIEEAAEALGWLPHTTRAALTGLRRKGHAVVRDKQGSVTIYRIVAP